MYAPEAFGYRALYGELFRADLQAMVGSSGSVLAAQVCTADGFEVASIQRDEESHRRLAAMVSALHSLGAALVEETALGSCSTLIIEASAGKCLMMALPGTHGALLLAVVSDATALFGQVHLACRKCCEALAVHVAAGVEIRA